MIVQARSLAEKPWPSGEGAFTSPGHLPRGIDCILGFGRSSLVSLQSTKRQPNSWRIALDVTIPCP